MPRRARIVVPGRPHHVVQRGNFRQDAFLNRGDHLFYLHMLEEQCRDAGVRILSYCLMVNHVHLVLVPEEKTGLAVALGRTHQLHSLRMNQRHDRSGHLWQSRFYSAPMDDAYLVAAMRYVEQNPVRAGLVNAPWEFQWSSAAAHCGHATPPSFLDDSWSRRFPPEIWKKKIHRPRDGEADQVVRSASRKGWPLGDDQFVQDVESQ